MKTYKLTIEVKKKGDLMETREITVTTLIPPKVGEGRALLTDPPIIETIVKVEEVKD